MKVLIVKTSSMGDVIHTFPAVEDALRARPEVSFGWCVEESFDDIVRLHPRIAPIHRVALRRWRRSPFSLSTWKQVRSLRRELRSEAYDLVIDAQGLLKSAVVARMAGAPVAGLDAASAREPLAAFAYRRRIAVPMRLHAIDRTRRLFAAVLGYSPDCTRQYSGLTSPTWLADHSQAFLLHGASRDDKKWDVDEWCEVARMCGSRGLTPVTTWSNEEERAVAETIAAAMPDTQVMPKSALRDVAVAIGGCDLVIGVDTGLTHLASAFGIPTVAVFLASRPELTGPRGNFTTSVEERPGEPADAARVMAEADRLIAARNLARDR